MHLVHEILPQLAAHLFWTRICMFNFWTYLMNMKTGHWDACTNAGRHACSQDLIWLISIAVLASQMNCMRDEGRRIVEWAPFVTFSIFTWSAWNRCKRLFLTRIVLLQTFFVHLWPIHKSWSMVYYSTNVHALFTFDFRSPLCKCFTLDAFSTLLASY